MTLLNNLLKILITFFINKIRDIRKELSDSSDNTQLLHNMEKRNIHCELSEFISPSNKNIQDIMTSFSNKTCALHPIPTHIVKGNINLLLPFISTIVRQYIATGVFPTSFRTSLVRPKVKKHDLEPDLFVNYRPIANIPFLSKVIEKSVTIQVHNYLNCHGLFPSLQSAYRKHHSTESALLRVSNDIFRILDSQGEVILVLLDLSAAFDTIDHHLLLTRLRTYFNFTETVLQWFSSYVLDRFQQVSISDSTSSPRCIEYGLPQGSILGPLLFILYLAPLQDVILTHDLNCMFYADDTQIYIAIKAPEHSVDSVEILQACVNDVFAWNTQNMLKSNSGKTEILHFTSRFKKQPSSLKTLTLAHSAIGIKAKAKNLGIVMDKTLFFNDHINETCKKASFAMRSIGRIPRYLPYDGLKMLVNSLVISRLDYCNSVLYGIPKYQRDKLQRIQNIAARMITGTRSTDHITLILKNLHWLPVKARMNFKILLITYKILNGKSTSYLEPIIQEYHPLRTLRSSTNSYGGRAFSASAPKLWNSIPEYIKRAETVETFKSRLKTFFFLFNE